MKQKDITVIVFAVIISVLISVIVSKQFITAPKNRQQQVEVVTPITQDFNTPSNANFNENSIDPTQLIKIGDTTTKKPFNNPNH